MRVAMTALVAASAVLGGCRTMNEDTPATPTGQDQRFTCDATRVQAMIGQAASQTLGADAVRASGARTMRWIRPGDMVTQDYRTDRLNVHLDAQNRVERLTCG